MTYNEIAVAFGLKNARRLQEFQTRFERAIIAEIRAKEAKDAPKKPRRRRPPEWCLPPWERKNGCSNVVYITTTRSRLKGAKGLEGYWLFEDGKPRLCLGNNSQSWRGMADWAATYETINLWSADNWELEKAANPQIAEVLKAYEDGYNSRLAAYEAARKEAV